MTGPAPPADARQLFGVGGVEEAGQWGCLDAELTAAGRTTPVVLVSHKPLVPPRATTTDPPADPYADLPHCRAWRRARVASCAASTAKNSATASPAIVAPPAVPAW